MVPYAQDEGIFALLRQDVYVGDAVVGRQVQVPVYLALVPALEEVAASFEQCVQGNSSWTGI